MISTTFHLCVKAEYSVLINNNNNNNNNDNNNDDEIMSVKVLDNSIIYSEYEHINKN